jgi:hypothetical protein
LTGSLRRAQVGLPTFVRHLPLLDPEQPMSMKSLLSHRPSAAMVVACAALVVALGGTASAAALINGHSIKANTVTGVQVKESTLKIVPSAKWANGLTPLPSGKSMTGMFGSGAGDSTSGWVGDSITYPRPLKTAIPDTHIIDVQGTSGTHCPGIGRAQKGYLCLYNGDVNGVDLGFGYSDDNWLYSGGKSYGVVLYWSVTGTIPYVGGTWTVTAP